MRALEGLRVLDLSRFQACPLCGMMLADMGAEVIRIEQRFDAVAQARSGAMVLNGFPDDPPLKTTVTHIDVSTGLMATIGVLVALYHRDKRGLGQAIDVSLFDTASFATQALGALLLYNLYGEVRTRVGNKGFHSYAGCHKARDKWIMINPATNTIWKRFVRAIGQPDMARDPRFSSDMDRFRNAALIDPAVKEWVEQRTVAEILGVLDEARIPCSVVNTIDEALQDRQVAARDMIVHLDYPGLGTLPIPGLPIKLSLTPGSIDRPSPRLGEQNEEVYCKLLGLSPEKLDRLKKEGII